MLDGVNAHGLAVSLAYGGRHPVGDGFAITVVLRYILEFCSEVAEAVEVLRRVPIHVGYNVALLDRQGRHATVFVAPDRPARVEPWLVSANRQAQDPRPDDPSVQDRPCARRWFRPGCPTRACTLQQVIETFLAEPVWRDPARHGWGTLYTACYLPAEALSLRWRGSEWHQTVDRFERAADGGVRRSAASGAGSRIERGDGASGNPPSRGKLRLPSIRGKGAFERASVDPRHPHARCAGMANAAVRSGAAVETTEQRWPGFFGASLAEVDPELSPRSGPSSAASSMRSSCRGENIVSRAVLEAQGSVHQQVRRGLSRQALLWRLPACRRRRVTGHRAGQAAVRLRFRQCAAPFGRPGQRGGQAGPAVARRHHPGHVLDAGGHLTHGAKPAMSGKWFKAVQYGVRAEDGLIDFDQVERLAQEHKPKMIIAGPRPIRFIDFAAFGRSPTRSAHGSWSTWHTSPGWWPRVCTRRQCPTPMSPPPPRTRPCAARVAV